MDAMVKFYEKAGKKFPEERDQVVEELIEDLGIHRKSEIADKFRQIVKG